jgi:hypothetical protein
MGSIFRDIRVAASADFVCAAIRDTGAPHTRLARGFVVDTKVDAGARVVTFGNGLSARELIVDVDDTRRRFAYSIVAGRATHHNASFEVIADGDHAARVLWTTDVLPHELIEPFSRMVDAGVQALKTTVEADYAATSASGSSTAAS